MVSVSKCFWNQCLSWASRQLKRCNDPPHAIDKGGEAQRGRVTQLPSGRTGMELPLYHTAWWSPGPPYGEDGSWKGRVMGREEEEPCPAVTCGEQLPTVCLSPRRSWGQSPGSRRGFFLEMPRVWLVRTTHGQRTRLGLLVSAYWNLNLNPPELPSLWSHSESWAFGQSPRESLDSDLTFLFST